MVKITIYHNNTKQSVVLVSGMSVTELREIVNALFPSIPQQHQIAVGFRQPQKDGKINSFSFNEVCVCVMFSSFLFCSVCASVFLPSVICCFFFSLFRLFAHSLFSLSLSLSLFVSLSCRFAVLLLSLPTSRYSL
jgi:hypothetical protein